MSKIKCTNHNQTKLEMAAAALAVADEAECDYGNINQAISKAFRQFSREICERLEKEAE